MDHELTTPEYRAFVFALYDRAYHSRRLDAVVLTTGDRWWHQLAGESVRFPVGRRTDGRTTPPAVWGRRSRWR